MRFLETLAFDLRLGARSLRRAPAVTGAALVTVALAVGATTLIWAVVDAVLLRPLPYREPERLVQLWESHPEQGPRVVVSRGNYLDWLERAEAFEALGAYMPGWGRGLTGDGPPVQVTTALVTPSLLRLLQVEAAEGRTFTESEGEPGKDDAALLSEGFWRRRFGGDPEVLGRTLTLDGESYRVVGVMPAGFDVPTREVDVWLPMSFPLAYYEQREAHTLHVVGRLAPGTSVQTADAAMDRLARSLGEEHPEVAGWEVTVVPLHEQRVGEVRPALLILLGAVGVLLAAACFNVAKPSTSGSSSSPPPCPSRPVPPRAPCRRSATPAPTSAAAWAGAPPALQRFGVTACARPWSRSRSPWRWSSWRARGSSSGASSRCGAWTRASTPRASSRPP